MQLGSSVHTEKMKHFCYKHKAHVLPAYLKVAFVWHSFSVPLQMASEVMKQEQNLSTV